jgi:hypothetical protein
MNNVNHFIFQGGAENKIWFLNKHYRAAAGAWFWSAQKTAKVGDIAFIYLTAPLSRIVGKVEIKGEPFYNYPNRFENPIMLNRYCVEVEYKETFEIESELLTMKNLRKVFADWSYLRYPRGGVRIPDAIVPPFLELVGKIPKEI